MEFVSEVLSGAHHLDSFSCGETDLDDWLKKAARDSDGRRITKTYVVHRCDEVVVGYYALMPFIIQRDELSRSDARGRPDRVPGFLIAKLALSTAFHGQRLGSQLLASACERAARAAEHVCGRLIIVDAASPNAVTFYSHHGFRLVPGHPDRLMLSCRDVLARLR